MASIRKRAGSWQAQVRLQGHPPVARTFDTKAAAYEWAQQVEHDIERGAYDDRSRAESITLGAALDMYAERVTPRKRGAAQERRLIKRLGERLKKLNLAQLPMAAVRATHFVTYRDVRFLDSVTAATVRLELALISHLFSTARKEWGMALDNPIADLTMPKKSQERDRRLTSGEEEQLLVEARRFSEMPQVIILAIDTAMRRGEIAAMQWSWVDWTAGVLKIPANFTKSGKRRMVPLSPRALHALREQQKGAGQDPSARVFKVSINFISIAFARIVQTLGIRNLRFHDLRHEATSRLFEAGLQMVEVASITGHQDYRTLARYTHPDPLYLRGKLGWAKPNEKSKTMMTDPSAAT